WYAALGDPWVNKLTLFHRFFEAHPWYKLEPAAGTWLLTSGNGTWGSTDYALAARSSDGTFAAVYIPSPRGVVVDLSQMAGPVRAQWFDPTNGAYTLISNALPNSGTQWFNSPSANSDGDGDFLLVLEVK